MKHAPTVSTAAPPADPLDRIIFLPELRRIVPLDRTTIWRLRKEGRFPEPVNLGVRRNGWRLRTIYGWLDARGSR